MGAEDHDDGCDKARSVGMNGGGIQHLAQTRVVGGGPKTTPHYLSPRHLAQCVDVRIVAVVVAEEEAEAAFSFSTVLVNRLVLCSLSASIGRMLHEHQQEDVITLVVPDLPGDHLRQIGRFLSTGSVAGNTLDPVLNESFLGLGIDLGRLNLVPDVDKKEELDVPVNTPSLRHVQMPDETRTLSDITDGTDQKEPNPSQKDLKLVCQSLLKTLEEFLIDATSTNVRRRQRILPLLHQFARLAADTGQLKGAARQAGDLLAALTDIKKEESPHIDGFDCDPLQNTETDDDVGKCGADPFDVRASLNGPWGNDELGKGPQGSTPPTPTKCARKTQKPRPCRATDYAVTGFKTGPRDPTKTYQCHLCSSGFMEKTLYDLHQQRHMNNDKSLKFFCAICERGFSQYLLLKRHFRAEHKEKHRCSFCPMQYSSSKYKEYLSHLEDHERGVSGLECLQCGKVSKDLARTAMHCRVKGLYHTNQCHQCPATLPPVTFKSWPAHQRHVEEVHDGRFMHVCGICTDVFPDESKRRSHRLEKHKSLLNVNLNQLAGGDDGVTTTPAKKTPTQIAKMCDVCGKVVNCSNLKSHLMQAHGREQLPCQQQQCSKEFKSETSLKIHMNTSHSKFPCEICGKPQSGKQRYQIHLASVHTPNDERPFICRFCGKGFGRKRAWQEHENIHTGNKPHKCRYEGCQAAFFSVASLRGHEKARHEGDKRTQRPTHQQQQQQQQSMPLPHSQQPLPQPQQQEQPPPLPQQLHQPLPLPHQLQHPLPLPQQLQYPLPLPQQQSQQPQPLSQSQRQQQLWPLPPLQQQLSQPQFLLPPPPLI